VHNVCNLRQIEVHTAEPLVPGPSRLEVEIAIAKLKKYKSQGSDQISTELISAGGEMLLSAIHKLINSVAYNERVHQLFIDFKKTYDSVRREVLYNILIELIVGLCILLRVYPPIL
jgi:hypothetical protein